MDIKECLDRLVEAVKECPQLERYNEARAELKKYPDKEKRVQEYRKKNYELQNAGDEIDLFSETDRLADSFFDVYQDPVMQDYLKAETALCKVVQMIDSAVIGCLDFEGLPDDE